MLNPIRLTASAKATAGHPNAAAALGAPAVKKPDPTPYETVSALLSLPGVIDKALLLAVVPGKRRVGDLDHIRSGVLPFQVHRIFSHIRACQLHRVRVE